LGNAGYVPDPPGRGGGDRLDQLDRQPGWILWSLYVGFMKDATGSYTGGLYGLAPFGFVAAAITAFFLDIPNPTPVRRQAAE